MKLIVQKYKYSIIWLMVVVFLSLMPTRNLPEIDTSGLKHMDKLVHFTMYFVLCFVLIVDSRFYLYFKKKELKIRHIAAIFFLSVGVGGLMELLQTVTGRTNDMNDFVANTIGAFISPVVYSYFKRNCLFLRVLRLFRYT